MWVHLGVGRALWYIGGLDNSHHISSSFGTDPSSQVLKGEQKIILVVVLDTHQPTIMQKGLPSLLSTSRCKLMVLLDGVGGASKVPGALGKLSPVRL